MPKPAAVLMISVLAKFTGVLQGGRLLLYGAPPLPSPPSCNPHDKDLFSTPYVTPNRKCEEKKRKKKTRYMQFLTLDWSGNLPNTKIETRNKYFEIA